MNTKYMIAVDMDVTLLNSSGKVTDRTIKTLQSLVEAGHYLVPASGRSYSLLPKEILGLKGLGYGVLENGAIVYDIAHDKILSQSPMPEGKVSAILADVWQKSDNWSNRYFTEIIADGIGYGDADEMKHLDEARIGGSFIPYMKNGHEYMPCIRQQDQLLSRAEKLNIYFEDIAFSKSIRDQWCQDTSLAVTSSVYGNAEFNLAGVNKGVGLKSLMEYLKVDAEHVIAIGDNVNDIEMLALAGISVAMGNAADDIKNTCRYVTADCDHDGAAAFLEEFLTQSGGCEQWLSNL